jgi:integrase
LTAGFTSSKRSDSRYWQCATFLNGRSYRTTTKHDILSHAKDFAEDWYLDLRGKVRMGLLQPRESNSAQGLLDGPARKTSEKTFREAADAFIPDYRLLTHGQRSPGYIETMQVNLRVHLIPFFEKKSLSQITSGLVHDYRIHRLTSRKHPKTGEPMRPARSTLHHEIVTLRQVLKYAHLKGWLTQLPDLSTPYKSSGKVTHRAWFSPEEYKRLYEATRERAKNPKNERWRTACENMHDYVLFMANTGLRPDEASRLQTRDVAIVTDEATGERILQIEVHQGKRGTGFCKSMPGAVVPFQRLVKRNKRQPTDRLFGSGKVQRELLNTILGELGLKFDRDGNRRTAYSLRHTYICLRLMEGADIYQIAKNCRTSVEMIEKYYARHIANSIDTSLTNVRKPKKSKSPPKQTKPDGGSLEM